MLPHLIYIIVVLSCSYLSNGVRIVRDTSDIPTEKFKPVKTDDYELSIHQRSSSSVQGVGEDNREYRFEGVVRESGGGPDSHYFSIQLPEPHYGWLIASSDSNTTQRYDSWEVTTQPSRRNEDEDKDGGPINPFSNPGNSRRNSPQTVDPPTNPNDFSNPGNSRRNNPSTFDSPSNPDFLGNPGNSRRISPQIVDSPTNPNDFSSPKNSRRNNRPTFDSTPNPNSLSNPVNSRRNNRPNFNSPPNHIPIRYNGDDEMMTAENFRLYMLNRNPNHVFFSNRD